MPRVILFEKKILIKRKTTKKKTPFGVYGLHNGCASFLTVKGGEKCFSPDILKRKFTQSWILLVSMVQKM